MRGDQDQELYNKEERNFESQLNEYKKRISNILESFTDGFFEVDEYWTVTYFNKEAENLLMVSRSDVIGRNLWSVFTEAIPLKFYSEYHKAVSENVAVRFEEYFPPNDLWVEVAAFPSGQGLSVYFKDISSRKKATQLLEQERKKYSELFNFSPVPQWVFDLETTRFLDVNEAAVKHYGYTRDEFLTMSIKDIRPPEEVGHLEKILTEHVKSGFYNQSRVRHRKKNGEIISVLVEGNSLNFEGRTARLVMAIDRTKEIESELAREESIARFDIVSKATSDAIWDWDMLSGTMVWNQGIKGIFGYKKTTYDEAWWRSKVHPDDLDVVEGKLKLLSEKNEQRFHVKYRFQSADGGYRCVLDRAFIIFDDAGVPVRLIGSMQDITAYENQLKEIEEQNNRLKRISWIQSHKVRGPLARIIGLASLIDENVLSPDEKTEFTADIKTAAQELDKVVEEIVHTTESGKEPDLATPAFTIRKMRIQRGWTQKQVAEQLGITADTYSEWEAAQPDLSYSILAQIAGVFGVSVKNLMSEESY